MRQQSFSAQSFEKNRKKTRKEIFLEEMDQIIPWQEVSEVVKPHYPAPKGADRRPIGIERMHAFNFSNTGLSYPILVLKKRYTIPVQLSICRYWSGQRAGTILQFRHLMERNDLGDELVWLTNVDWFNNRRILEPSGNIPPAEYELMHYQ